MKTFYVYILASKRNGTIYVGFTDDIERRVREHKEKSVSGFTAKYGVTKLVYFETFEDSYQAFERERRMKKWKRAWKLRLIEKDNPDWNDLSEDWE
jgi:putative endonuclease